MAHTYVFLDHDAVDPLWRLSWGTLAERSARRWVLSNAGKYDEYNGTSAREFLAFFIEPEPTIEQMDKILAEWTLRATIQHCAPQFYAIEELVRHATRQGARGVLDYRVEDISGVIAVAARAFLDRRIGSRTLWAVAKLHSCGIVDWVQLGQDEIHSIEVGLPWERMWEPVYSWQVDSFLGAQWTNCLRAADTARFTKFLTQAYEENWPAAQLKSPLDPQAKTACFQDFEECVSLARVVKRQLGRLQRPFVYRMWD